MEIPPYKIHHILKAYTKRLARIQKGEDAAQRCEERDMRCARLPSLIHQISERIIRAVSSLKHAPADENERQSPKPDGNGTTGPENAT